jgi:hypothetical protein
MMLLPMMLEMQKTVICHGGCISSWGCGVEKDVIEMITGKYTAKKSRVFFCPLFLQDSSTKATAFLILFCLNEPNWIKNEVWFYRFRKEVLDYPVLSRFFSSIEIKAGVSSLCMGDSSLDHVPLHSPTVPRLARIHQKTITLHSHCKTGDVVWRLGM